MGMDQLDEWSRSHSGRRPLFIFNRCLFPCHFQEVGRHVDCILDRLDRSVLGLAKLIIELWCLAWGIGARHRVANVFVLSFVICHFSRMDSSEWVIDKIAYHTSLKEIFTHGYIKLLAITVNYSIVFSVLDSSDQQVIDTNHLSHLKKEIFTYW